MRGEGSAAEKKETEEERLQCLDHDQRANILNTAP